MKKEPDYKNTSLRIVGGSIPLVLILGEIFEVSHRLTIPYAIVAAMIVAAALVWTTANHKARGSEWWQDDEASGWRGY